MQNKRIGIKSLTIVRSFLRGVATPLSVRLRLLLPCLRGVLNPALRTKWHLPLGTPLIGYTPQQAAGYNQLINILLAAAIIFLLIVAQLSMMAWAQNGDKPTDAKRILIISTSSNILHLKDGTERPTGVWAEELLEPKDIFTKAGIKVDVATLGGKKPPFDKDSLSPEMLGGQKRADEYKKKIANDYEINHPLNLNNLQKKDIFKYDAIFIAGGHGALDDLPNSEQVGKILSWSLRNNKQLTCAVCHGPAAFMALEKVGEKNALKGIQMTGFSDEEEKAAGLYDKVPFDLEPTLKKWGVIYQQTNVMWGPFVVKGKKTNNGIPTVITGQNPASSVLLATEIVNLLKK